MSREFDPVTLEILWNRLIAVTDEMTMTLLRTAFSSVVREARDMACALFDAQGRMVAGSSKCTAGLVGTTVVSVKNIIREFPVERLRPGDTLITNDPWVATGHLLDTTVLTPVFQGDRLVAFSVAVTHLQDIGGRFSTMDSAEIYEEGIRIPVCKLEEGGREVEVVVQFIRNNVRDPDIIIGDIRAQVIANRAGAAGVLQIMEDEGLDSIDELADEIITRTEKDMRAGISAIPDGTYRQALTIDPYGGFPLRIEVAITVSGSDILVDFTGTSEQIPYAINSPIGFTRSYTLIPIKGVISATTPNNEGIIRPVRTVAPEGTILSAVHPAPLTARQSSAGYAAEAILGALSKAVPDKVFAGCAHPIWIVRFGGKDRVRGSFHTVQFINGGFGARPNKDGFHCTPYPGNVSTVPVELLESDSPLLVEKKAIRVDSGGPGRFRGGCGIDLVTKVLERFPAADGRPRQDTDQVTMGSVMLSVRADRYEAPASGWCGGHPGALGQVLINEELVNRRGTSTIQPGDAVLWRVPGGGGFWNPLERDPAAVLADVREAYVSVEGASRDYGVVIAGDPPAVDEKATDALRQRLLSETARGGGAEGGSPS